MENETLDTIQKDKRKNDFFLNCRIDFAANGLFDEYGATFDKELQLTGKNFMMTQVKRWRMKIEQKLIDTSTVCKICGTKVPVSYLLTHSKFCLKSYDIRQNIKNCDIKILAKLKGLKSNLRKLKLEATSMKVMKRKNSMASHRSIGDP